MADQRIDHDSRGALLIAGGRGHAIHYTYTPFRIQVINRSSEWRNYFEFQDEQFGFGEQQFVYDPFLL
jgi:hypothetical protein